MHPYKDMLQEFLTQRVRLYRLKYNYSQETMSVFLRISARAYFDLEQWESRFFCMFADIFSHTSF
jgi:hypothetical protein